MNEQIIDIYEYNGTLMTLLLFPLHTHTQTHTYTNTHTHIEISSYQNIKTSKYQRRQSDTIITDAVLCYRTTLFHTTL